MSDNVATMAGFTEEIKWGELPLLIQPAIYPCPFRAWDMDNQEFITVIDADMVEREILRFDDEMDAERALLDNVNHRRFVLDGDTDQYIVLEVQSLKGSRSMTGKLQIIGISLIGGCYQRGRRVDGWCEFRLDNGATGTAVDGVGGGGFDGVLKHCDELGYDTLRMRERLNEWTRTGKLPAHEVDGQAVEMGFRLRG